MITYLISPVIHLSQKPTVAKLNTLHIDIILLNIHHIKTGFK
jgi:hypothetical protein